ncbi:DUF2064 domain-containing protein [Nocardia sp. NPDC005978]|uniref:TIGR04282 family arsenosugar biosynthesis glycosyltransferase n=1 Tax=Nocardia sp. NPDC005978 TaxID=3156725 RepID=UPI0033ACE749
MTRPDSAATVLVVAKAPIAGFAKTRLTPPLRPRDAARLAASALLDTLAAVRASSARHRVVAWTGELAVAEEADAIAAALRDFTVVPQRGNTFGERLANAHADAARHGAPVLQIGMDTPQIDADLLDGCLARLLATGDSVLGPAVDGGWWALGVTDPRAARALVDVPMSTPQTGEFTRAALRRNGFHVHALPMLTDVDHYADALAVAARCRGRFAATLALVAPADPSAPRITPDLDLEPDCAITVSPAGSR